MKILSSLSLKAKVIAGVATAAAVAGTITLVLVLSGSPDAFRLLKVFEMTGKSIITRVNTGAMDAYEGMNLESGDVVEVGENSTMTLSLDSNKYLSLDPNTVLELIAEGTEADSKTSVNLRSGGVLNEITEPLSAESSYSVNTPKATMAVRGTSFYVSVRALDDGSYITDISVFHGKVEVQLLDEQGNPKGEPVMIEPNESVAILTVPVEGNTTGAEINGTSCFILRKSDGSDVFAVLGEGENPIMPLNVHVIPKSVIERVLNTHDSADIILNEEVLRALLGDNTYAEGSETTAAIEADETAAETTTVPESETTVSETTVPVTEESVEETTVTAVTTAPVTEETEVTTVTAGVTATEKSSVTTSEFEIVEETFEDPSTDKSEKTTKETTARRGTEYFSPVPSPVSPVTTTAPITTGKETTTEITTTTEETTTSEETTTAEETTTTEETTEEEPAVYQVTFVTDPDENIIDVQEVEEGEYAEEPFCPPYFTANDGNRYVYIGIESALGPITSDTTISVKYAAEDTVIQVIVSDNGTQIDSVYRVRGESYTLPAAPTGDGVLPFRYWGLQQSGMDVTPYQPNQSITVQDSLTVGYKDGSYTSIMFDAVYGKLVTVTFLDYDGTVLGTAQGYQGESVALPANPTREGYSFDDWYTDDGDYFSGYISSDYTTDFTVTAKYTGNSVTLTFICNGITYDTVSSNTGNSYLVPSFDNAKFATAYANANNGAVLPAELTVNSYTVTGVDIPCTIGDTIIVTGDMTFDAIVN